MTIYVEDARIPARVVSWREAVAIIDARYRALLEAAPAEGEPA